MNWSKPLAVTALLLIAVSPALAANQQPKADPRALESCKARSSSFVQISGCLPSEHVGVITLDAFSSVYPPAAAPLKTVCLEKNKGNFSAASACVTEAIKSALALNATMPEGADIGDPVFSAVSDPSLMDALKEHQTKAREAFPDQLIWGGGVYHSYQ